MGKHDKRAKVRISEELKISNEQIAAAGLHCENCLAALLTQCQEMLLEHATTRGAFEILTATSIPDGLKEAMLPAVADWCHEQVAELCNERFPAQALTTLELLTTLEGSNKTALEKQGPLNAQLLAEGTALIELLKERHKKRYEEAKGEFNSLMKRLIEAAMAGGAMRGRRGRGFGPSESMGWGPLDSHDL